MNVIDKCFENSVVKVSKSRVRLYKYYLMKYKCRVSLIISRMITICGTIPTTLSTWILWTLVTKPLASLSTIK